MFLILFSFAACQQAGERPIPTEIFVYVQFELPDREIFEPEPEIETSLYTAIFPIGVVDSWQAGYGQKRQFLGKKTLERVHYRFGDRCKTFVTVNRYVFELPFEPATQDVHFTQFSNGGANLTHQGETYVAVDYIQPQHFMSERTPDEKNGFHYGPSL